MLLRLFIFSVLLSFEGHASKRIVLESNVSKKLIQLIRSASELHSSLVDGNEAKITENLLRLNVEVSSHRREFAKDRMSHRHLDRVLESIEDSIVVARTTYLDRNQALKKMYHQITNLPRMYRLNARFKIFFCRGDKSTWVQSSWKPKNPLSKTYFNCGVRVR